MENRLATMRREDETCSGMDRVRVPASVMARALRRTGRFGEVDAAVRTVMREVPEITERDARERVLAVRDNVNEVTHGGW